MPLNVPIPLQPAKAIFVCIDVLLVVRIAPPLYPWRVRGLMGHLPISGSYWRHGKL